MKSSRSCNVRVVLPCLLFPLLFASSSPAAERYDLSFSTYIGGSADDQIRDVAVDDQGNVYITGGTKSSDFPTTSGATFQGVMDVFVTKFDPNGKLTWSTLIGGPEYDRAYAIEVNKQGYVCGRPCRSQFSCHVWCLSDYVSGLQRRFSLLLPERVCHQAQTRRLHGLVELCRG